MGFVKLFTTKISIVYLPFFRISLGPVGQSVEITNFFKANDSSKTLGSPSYKDVKTNIIVGFWIKDDLLSAMSNVEVKDKK